MLQREKSKGSCFGSMSFISIKPGKENCGACIGVGLVPPVTFVLPCRRAAPFLGAAGAWAAGGLGLGTAYTLPSAATAALLFLRF